MRWILLSKFSKYPSTGGRPWNDFFNKLFNLEMSMFDMSSYTLILVSLRHNVPHPLCVNNSPGNSSTHCMWGLVVQRNWPPTDMHRNMPQNRLVNIQQLPHHKNNTHFLRIKFSGEVTLTELEGGKMSNNSLISTTFNFVPCLNHGWASNHS